ncbi:MAG TPA: extracellular solute-binding protein [Anaeromyxobacter sp.]|nr:extracellular solute-binding protein [Anaeromyxobacter sp.]
MRRFRSFASSLLVALAALAPRAAVAQQKVLKVWHYEAEDGAMGIAWADAIQRFEASHPGVKVQLEIKGFEQIRQTAAMVLNSDQVPDVMEYNKGNATAGLLSTQGLLTDLTAVAQKRGWDKLLGPSLQTTCRYDDRGIMGAGKWFGVTNYGEFVMVYYNRDLFQKHGQKVPTTLAELEATMAAFQKAGLRPLALGAAEYPGQHVLYELALTKANRAFVNAFQLYQGKFSFTGPEFSFAAQKLQEWTKKGFIAKDATGQKAEQMGLDFIAGKAPIMISGSWWYGRLVNEVKGFQWGIFTFPGGAMHPGSGGNLWVVPARAKSKDLAYDFIDLTMSKDVQNLLGNSGGVPVNADPAKVTNAKAKELIETFATLNRSDGLAFYPDWPAAGFYDTLVGAVQDLLLGKPAPEVLKALDQAYADNKPE